MQEGALGGRPGMRLLKQGVKSSVLKQKFCNLAVNNDELPLGEEATPNPTPGHAHTARLDGAKLSHLNTKAINEYW